MSLENSEENLDLTSKEDPLGKYQQLEVKNDSRKENVNPFYQIALFEFKQNFFTVKMLVVGVLFVFVIVASTYGLINLANSQGIDTPVGNLKLESNEEVILSTMSPFLSYMGALMAVVFGFSTITKEFSGKRIDILASTPVKISSLVLGKLFGVTIALGIPVTLSLPVVVLLIRFKLGDFPSLFGVAAFWFFTMVFLMTFVLFSFVFATFSRSPGASVTYGITLFLIYTFFWPLITAFFQSLLGYKVGIGGDSTKGALVVMDRVGLINPVINYQNAVAFIFEKKEVHGMPSWLPALILVLMAVGLTFAVINLFKRRITYQNY